MMVVVVVAVVVVVVVAMSTEKSSGIGWEKVDTNQNSGSLRRSYV